MTSAILRLYQWACERLYNEFAWTYDLTSWLVSGGRWGTWRNVVLDYLPPGRVLELGFGTGELLVALAAQHRPLAGLELSPAMQRIAAHKLRTAGLATAAGRARGAAQHLPFADGCFEAVVSTFPANYIFDPATVAETARVLRRPAATAGAADGPAGEHSAGGRLVVAGIAVTLANPLLARLAPVFYGEPPAAALDRWQAVLTTAGLQPNVIYHASGGARVLLVVAEKQA